MLMPPLNLLRRTFVACLTLAAAVLSGNSLAQTFTCSNPTITPSNSFTITCTPATTVAGAPAITSGGSASGTVSQSFSYQITATNNPTSFNASGLPAGLIVSATSGLISGTPTAAGTTNASVSATNATGTGSLGLAITIASVGQPPPPPPPQPASGCPTATYTDFTLTNGGTSGPWTLIRLASNSVATFTLPTVNPGHRSGVLYPGVTSTSPSGGNVLEVTISKCKGEINPAAGSCYMKTQIVDGSSIQWAGAATTYDAATLDSYGFCNALPSSGPWYVNVRYQYQECVAGGSCGYTWTWYDSWL